MFQKINFLNYTFHTRIENAAFQFSNKNQNLKIEEKLTFFYFQI